MKRLAWLGALLVGAGCPSSGSERASSGPDPRHAHAPAPVPPSPADPPRLPWQVRYTVTVVDGEAPVAGAQLVDLNDGAELGATDTHGTRVVLVGYGDVVMASAPNGKAGMLMTSYARGERPEGRVVLRSPVTYTGRVTDAGGAPVAGAVIALESPRGSAVENTPPGVAMRPMGPAPDLHSWNRDCGHPTGDARIAGAQPVTTDADGRYRLALRLRFVPWIYVCAPGYVPQSLAYLLNRDADPLPETPIDVQLQRTAPVTGVVVDEHDAPLAGVKVEAAFGAGQMMIPDGAVNMTDEVTTGPDGRFSLEVPRHAHREIVATARGRRTVRRADVAAGTAGLLLRVEAIGASGALTGIFGRTFHLDAPGAPHNLVLEADGSFRAESGSCRESSVLCGQWSVQDGVVSLRATDVSAWHDEYEPEPPARTGTWLDRRRLTNVHVELDAQGQLVLAATEGARAVHEVYLPGARCAVCTFADENDPNGHPHMTSTRACGSHPVIACHEGLPSWSE